MAVGSWKVSVPLGLDSALEGLTRAVLKQQPHDIYSFAATYFEDLLALRMRQMQAQSAHNAGLSPSSTQDSNSKTGADDGSCAQAANNSTGTVEKDKVSADFTSQGDKQPEEPESNDTSYGVEATAVRTLAASTGTVAILGTTAKTPQSRRESRVSTIDNEETNNRVAAAPTTTTDVDNNKQEINADSINVEIKDEHKNASTNLVNNIKLDEVAKSVDKIQSVLNSSSTTEPSDKVVVPVEALTEKVDVDESSTKQTTTALVEDVKADDSTGVNNVNGAASPLEDGGFSENNFTSELEDEEDRPTTVLEIEKASSNTETRTSISENSENEDTKGIDDEISSEQLKTNSLSDTTLSESYNAGLDSVRQSDGDSAATPLVENAEEKEIKNGVSVDDLKNGELDSVGDKVVEEVDAVKKEISGIESKNDLGAVSKKEVEEEQIVKTVATKVESAPAICNSGADETYSNDVEKKAFESVVEKLDAIDVVNKVENGLPANSVLLASNRVEINGQVLPPDSVSSRVVDKNCESDKMSAAATTIQASFRGYQTRQLNAKDKGNDDAVETNSLSQEMASNDVVKTKLESSETNNLVQETDASRNVVQIKVMQLTEIVDEETEKKLESIIASKEGLIGEEGKMDAAATAIQASFRGYQTRQNIKKDDDKTRTADEKDSIVTTKVDEVSHKEIAPIDTTKADDVGHSVRDSVGTTKPDEASHKGKDSIDTTKAHNVKDSVEKVDEASLKEKNSINTIVADNSQSFDAQVDKVPDSVQQTKSDSPRNIQVETVKTSQESSDTSSFDSVQNGATSIDPVTCVSIVDKSEVGKKDNDKSSSVDSVVEIVVDKVTKVEESKGNVVEKVVDKVTKVEESKDNVVEKVLDKVTKVEESKDNVVEKVVNKVTKVEESKDNVVEKVLDKVTKVEESKENSISIGESKQKLLDDKKESSAATTIQANFRGYQARQNLQKKDVEGLEEENGDEEEEIGDDDNKVSTAATKIQAGFRGYQTRKKLKEDEDDSVVVEALTSRTPELVDSVREEVDEICKRAVETTETIISQGLHKLHKEENEGLAEKIDVVGVARQTVEALVEKAEKIADEKLNSAATTIQASFRGFQARQNLDKITDPDGLPDFPPSTEDEDYTPVPDDDDLPLPDLEALESSYSEEVATEPLLPAPLAASGPHFQNLTIPETEEVSEASTEVGTIEEDLKSLQRPQECDELDRLENSSDGESSLSSAATKIQAGVRGYLTRKQINNHAQAGTTSTSGPSLLSSGDRSLGDFGGSSREEDGPVRSMISTEEETEIGRHRGSPAPAPAPGAAKRIMTKRMSLDSRTAVLAPVQTFSRTSRAMSVSAVREDASSEEVWEMLQSELSSAATKIQSNFRGYQARKQLRRGDAVQMPTTSSSTTPGSNSLDSSSVSRTGTGTGTGHGGQGHARSSGEYHDMIALTPPNIAPVLGEDDDVEEVGKEPGEGKTASQSNGSCCSRDEDMMVKRRHNEQESNNQSRQQEQEEEEEGNSENSAAAKIQAGFRGYKVRRDMNAQDVATTTTTSSQQATNVAQSPPTNSNNHSSAEVEAATRIQAGFRGFKTRQELKSSKSADSK